MIVGLIIEANPYHNGHKYLVNKAFELYNDPTLICVTSTSFTMRGEISIIDKFTKINTYLQEGIDIITELPITSTLQSADYFAYNTVSTLHKLGVTDILVGCENDDISLLDYYYNIINSEEYTKTFKLNLSLNFGYKKTHEKTLVDLNISNELIKLFNSPNMTLTYQYYKVIKDNNYNINLKLIKRTTNYYQTTSTSSIYASASYIRDLVKNKEDFSKFIPYNYKILPLREAEIKLSTIINFQSILHHTPEDLDKVNNNDEGIINYIIKNGDFSSNYDTLLSSLKNKKYTINRIRRVLLSFILNIPKGYNKEDSYLRLLGMSHKGRNHVNKLPKEIKSNIFSTPKELEKLDNERHKTILNYELLSTKLYSLLSNDIDLYQNEFKLPIKKEEK